MQSTRRVAMSTEQNKAMIRRFGRLRSTPEIWRVRSLIFSPNYVEHSAFYRACPQASKRCARTSACCLPASPMCGDDPGHDCRGRQSCSAGEHRGHTHRAILGIPPTGKHAKWSFIDIHRIADGKFVEHWVETDQMSLMQQLGLILPPYQGSVIGKGNDDRPTVLEHGSHSRNFPGFWWLSLRCLAS